MSLEQRLKDDLRAVRVQPTDGGAIVRDLLQTLLGDVALERTRSRTMGDAEITALLRKYRANASVMLEASQKVGDDARAAVALGEIQYLDGVLPAMLTEHQLKGMVQAIMDGGVKVKGKIMSHFKDTHNGLFDGRMLATIVDDELARLKAQASAADAKP